MTTTLDLPISAPAGARQHRRERPSLPIDDLLRRYTRPTEPLAVTELAMLVRAIGDDPTLWAPRLRRPERDRWWIRLHGDEHLDVWLLTWLPGQSTDLHDHGASAAAFTVIRGLLEEVRPNATGGRGIRVRGAGDTARIERGVIHDVSAAEGDPAASIHAYSPPLTHMTYWSPAPDGRLRAERTVIRTVPEQESA